MQLQNRQASPCDEKKIKKRACTALSIKCIRCCATGLVQVQAQTQRHHRTSRTHNGTSTCKWVTGQNTCNRNIFGTKQRLQMQFGCLRAQDNGVAEQSSQMVRPQRRHQWRHRSSPKEAEHTRHFSTCKGHQRTTGTQADTETQKGGGACGFLGAHMPKGGSTKHGNRDGYRGWFLHSANYCTVYPGNTSTVIR